jgi:hypothetical protein
MIRLQEAYLCCNCEVVSDSATVCPACASRSLLALSRVLSRESSAQVPAGLWKAVSALEASLQ